jgi:hypothetical protein
MAHRPTTEATLTAVAVADSPTVDLPVSAVPAVASTNDPRLTIGRT